MTRKSLRLGVIGCGPMGAAIGTRWAKAGHHVTWSYSRSPARPSELARQAGHAAKGGSVRDAVESSDAILIAIPWNRLEDVVSQAPSLRGRVLLDCSLPMTESGSDLAVAWHTSGAEQLARVTEGRVVKAFNTIPAEFIAAERRVQDSSVFIAGDDAAAKSIAAHLVTDAGFVPADAGPLRMARYMEPFALLMGQMAYVQGDSPQIGYRIVSAGESKLER